LPTTVPTQPDDMNPLEKSLTQSLPPVRTTLCVVALALLSAWATPAAHAACWAANVAEPISNDGLPIGHASFVPLHKAMDTLETMARSNPGLDALPEVRLRLKRQVMDSFAPGSHPRDAALHVGGYGPKTWGPGECEVIPQADRLGAKAGISFFINSPLAPLQKWVADEQLTAYLEGERGEPMHGWPVYRGCAVLTANKQVWWMPVSVGEMLDYYAREQQRRIDDWDRRHRRHFDEPFDLAAAEARAADLRKLNEKAADAALLVARQRKAGEPEYLRKLSEARQLLVAELDGLRSTRAALASAELAEPYRLGSGRYRLPAPGESNKALKRLVKLDPAFGWDGRQRSRVQAIQVCPSELDKNPSYGPPMRQAVRALDFARIASLLN
jgi:hypothetical protein